MIRAFFIPFVLFGLALEPSSAATKTDPLASLEPEHPRLLVAKDGWANLRQRIGSDPDLREVTDRLLADAAQLLDRPPLQREMTGRRLLHVSREALERVMTWSMARHLTGDLRYAKRAEREMLAVAGFADWNPSHFLDVAEMTAALAIGYDWLHHDLGDGSREVIRQAILRHGLEPGLKVVRSGGWWTRRDNNWNQVCFGGLALGALAIADHAPEPAGELLVAARAGIVHGLGTYAPAGLYPEGPGYWAYGTLYQCLMIDALRSALGSSWDLEKSPGFLESAEVQIHLTGPTGRFFNFFDGHEGPALHPARFWFAREKGDPALLHGQLEPLRATLGRAADGGRPGRPLGLIALWWPGLPQATQRPDLPLAWQAGGPNPVAVFRSSWSDSGSLYLACKGGRADLSHAHMDAGSFVLEAGGVRWAVDLGSQSYHSLESKGLRLWDDRQNGQRWTVFRLNNRSHNTLTINDQLHRVQGAGMLVEGDPGTAKFDLSPVFAGQAGSVVREFAVRDGRVRIRDEITGVAPGASVRWTMATRAAVTVEGRRAVLAQAGKQLHARLSASSEASFSVIPADPPDDDFNAPNPGTWLLLVESRAPDSGELRIEVELSPGS